MIEKIKRALFSPLTIVLILVIPTFMALLRPGYFPMHDDISAMRLLEMDKCVKDGQIPCRWVPDMGYGYGYPQFNYYAPLPYYIMEVFHLGGLGFLDSVKAGFVLSLILSALGMYLLGKSLWGRAGGFVSALFYSYLPYRAVDMYVRGAVGELYGFAFLPFIFWSSKKILEGDKKARFIFALSLAALFTSHNITSMIFLPFLLGWTVFLIIDQKLRPLPDFKKRVLNLAASFAWGLGLSAFFTLPAFFERNLVHINSLIGGYFDYMAHFVSFGQLLFSSYWGYGTSEAGPWDEASFAIGIFHWAVPLMVFILALALKAKRKIPSLLFWIVSGVVALFMAHGRSTVIWNALPFAAFIQFPWRFLLLSGFFFSTAAGAISLFFPKGVRSLLYASAISFIVVLFYAGIFRPVKWLDLSDEQKFSGEAWRLQQTLSIFDYLPIDVQKGPIYPAPDMPQIVWGNAEIIDWDKGTDWQKGKVKVFEKTRIMLPIYYFPNWEVRLGDKKLDVFHEGELALVNVDIEAGEGELEARLKDTPIRTAANVVSIFALFLIPFYLKKK